MNQLKEIVKQLEFGNYQTKNGFHKLEMNLAFQKLKELSEKQNTPVFMKFKDLSKGTRFKYPDSEDIWVVLNTYNDGLIVKWNGIKNNYYQSHCSFVDEGWTLESKVEIVC